MRAHIERARERMDQRRADQKIRDRHISAAVKEFAAAAVAVTAREESRDREVAELQQRIQRSRDTATTEITELRARQGAALARMKDQGQTDDEIADLLGVTVRQARQLLTATTRTTPRGEQDAEPVVPVAEPVDLRRRDAMTGP
ncbi:hypothetical protein [Nocardia asteroides]